MQYTPIIPVRVPQPFDREGWLFEVKYDGFRGMADTRDGGFALGSKNGHDLASRFPSVREGLPDDVVLDGEIVVLDESGRPQFSDLMAARGRPTYIAFDVLYAHGRDLRRLPLSKRRKILADLGLQQPYGVETDGKALFRAVQKFNLEGIVAKGLSDPYDPERTRWLKVLNPAYTQKEGRAEKFNKRA